MNASESITYDAQSGFYYSADETPFSSWSDAYDYNVNYLGLYDDSGSGGLSALTPVGIDPSQQTTALQPSGANGINGPVNSVTLPGTSPGSTPDGWGFLNQLATTTMTTAGQAIGQVLTQQVTAGQVKLQQNLNKLSNNQPAPAPKPAMSGSSLLIFGVLGVVLLGGVAFKAGRR